MPEPAQLAPPGSAPRPVKPPAAKVPPKLDRARRPGVAKMGSRAKWDSNLGRDPTFGLPLYRQAKQRGSASA
jgi:hypothetical protein